MYIIRTLHGDVKADYDELELIKNWSGKGLLFLRNGAVNVSHITNIILDESRMNEVIKLPGENDEDVKRKIREDKSTDIFSSIRNRPALQTTNHLTLPGQHA